MKRTRRALEKEGRMDEASKYGACAAFPLLVRALAAALLLASADFTPTTFVLPGDYALFVEVGR